MYDLDPGLVKQMHQQKTCNAVNMSCASCTEHMVLHSRWAALESMSAWSQGRSPHPTANQDRFVGMNYCIQIDMETFSVIAHVSLLQR